MKRDLTRHEYRFGPAAILPFPASRGDRNARVTPIRNSGVRLERGCVGRGGENRAA
jgi:hypothetical protein